MLLQYLSSLTSDTKFIINLYKLFYTGGLKTIVTMEGKPGQLTRKQIVRLAAAILADKMTSLAEGYMDIDDATIKNLKYENKDNAQAFNREIIRHWGNRHPENQLEVCEMRHEICRVDDSSLEYSYRYRGPESLFVLLRNT